MKNNTELEEMLRRHGEELLASSLVPHCFDGRKEENMKRRTIFTKRIVIPAIIAAALGITALAVTIGWNAKLEEYLKPTDKQKTELSGAVTLPKATVTKDGVTLNILQTLNDDSNMYVLYEVTVPDGTTGLDDDCPVDALIDFDWESDDNQGFGTSYDKVLSRDGNKLTMVMFSNTNMKTVDGKAEFALYRVGDISGKWSVSWDYVCKDITKVYKPEAPVDLGTGNKNILKKVTVSPIAISVEVYGDDVVTSLHPIITFKDGSTIILKTENDYNATVCFMGDSDGSASSQGTTYISYRFDRIQDVANIKSITAGNAAVEIK